MNFRSYPESTYQLPVVDWRHNLQFDISGTTDRGDIPKSVGESSSATIPLVLASNWFYFSDQTFQIYCVRILFCVFDRIFEFGKLIKRAHDSSVTEKVYLHVLRLTSQPGVALCFSIVHELW
jgi:hypothetical protein